MTWRPGPLTCHPLMVRPFVFLLSRRPVVTPTRGRGAPLGGVDSLVHPESIARSLIRLGDTVREFPAYHVSPIPVWGMTERILAPLVALLSRD